MHDLISAQMEGIYFPITIREFGAHVEFRDLNEGEHVIDGVSVKTMLLSHPGNCLSYRIEYHGRSICYVTDNELYLPESPFYNLAYVEKLADFVRDAGVLITDTTYTDLEYESKVGWGHSCVSQVVDLADRANVKALHLFHHDPDQYDDDIDNKLEVAIAMLAERKSDVVCIAPAERDTFSF